MKLVYVEMHGFRGYRKPVRIEFAEGFTVIDGRNGVGKSTIFDAIEFALTGAINKYSDAKASGESVADYIWWVGEGQPAERYVEVAFIDQEKVTTIRREQFKAPDSDAVKRISEGLCDVNTAPVDPLKQLCASTIIRDEYITSLSLDLKETDRYALLRDALGANDSDAWIERATQLAALAKKRTTAAQQEVSAANAEAAASARRIDEVRAALVSDGVLAAAVQRLRAFTETAAPPDQLSAPTRDRIAQIRGRIDSLAQLSQGWATYQMNFARREGLARAVAE